MRQLPTWLFVLLLCAVVYGMTYLAVLSKGDPEPSHVVSPSERELIRQNRELLKEDDRKDSLLHRADLRHAKDRAEINQIKNERMLFRHFALNATESERDSLRAALNPK